MLMYVNSAQTALQTNGFLQFLQEVRGKDMKSASAMLRKGAVFLAWSCDGLMPENLIAYLRFED